MATQEIIKIQIDPSGAVSRETVGTAELPDEVFAEPVKQRYFWEVVRHIQMSKRAGTASTKTRAFVRGGGRKPWRQKGTGRARAGSRRSPLWRGGAVIFGPQPRDWSSRINKNFQRKALRAAVSARLNEGRLLVIDKFELPEIKTKLMQKILEELGATNALIIDANPDKVLVRSARNLPKVKVMNPNRLNVYDVLLHESLVFTKAGLEAAQGVLGK